MRFFWYFTGPVTAAAPCIVLCQTNENAGCNVFKLLKVYYLTSHNRLIHDYNYYRYLYKESRTDKGMTLVLIEVNVCPSLDDLVRVANSGVIMNE